MREVYSSKKVVAGRKVFTNECTVLSSRSHSFFFSKSRGCFAMPCFTQRIVYTLARASEIGVCAIVSLASLERGRGVGGSSPRLRGGTGSRRSWCKNLGRLFPSPVGSSPHRPKNRPSKEFLRFFGRVMNKEEHPKNGGIFVEFFFLSSLTTRIIRGCAQGCSLHLRPNHPTCSPPHTHSHLSPCVGRGDLSPPHVRDKKMNKTEKNKNTDPSRNLSPRSCSAPIHSPLFIKKKRNSASTRRCPSRRLGARVVTG